MNGCSRALVTVVAVMLVVTVTHTQDSGDVALRAAMEVETVKGDLRAAIGQYKAIVAGRDRAIAARALLRMAECYRKLGDAESRVAYERVVREFADQVEAATEARRHLASLSASNTQPTTSVARQVAAVNELGG